MKFKRNEKYEAIAVYSVISAIILITVYFFFEEFTAIRGVFSKILSVLSPLIYGAGIAYLCNPILLFFQNKVFVFGKRKNKFINKALPMIFTYLALFTLIGLFIYIVIPHIVSSYETLQDNFTDYFSNAQSWLDSHIKNMNFFGQRYENLNDLLVKNEIITDFNKFINNFYNYISGAAEHIVSYAGKFVIEVKNLLMGLILSVYFLSSKRMLSIQLKKVAAAIFSRRFYISLINLIRYTDKSFGAFIKGKILDSAIIGILTFIVLQIFNFPFTPLIALIIGVTNVIPVFGPFIGAIPSAFLVLISSPGKVIWFIIIIIIIQQLDGNFIGPKILGNATGVSSFWVIISITIGSGLYGVMGMFLAVPTFAVIYAIVKELAEHRLAKKNLSCDTKFYENDPPMKNIDKIFTDDNINNDSSYNKDIS